MAMKLSPVHYWVTPPRTGHWSPHAQHWTPCHVCSQLCEHFRQTSLAALMLSNARCVCKYEEWGRVFGFPEPGTTTSHHQPPPASHKHNNLAPPATWSRYIESCISITINNKQFKCCCLFRAVFRLILVRVTATASDPAKATPQCWSRSINCWWLLVWAE